LARRDNLAPVGVQVSLGVGGLDVVEVGIAVGLGELQVRHILTGRALAEPPALRVGQVPDQAQKRKVRRRNRTPRQLPGRQPGALRLQGVTVVVEPLLKRPALGSDEGRVSALHRGCGPLGSHARPRYLAARG
jgi:hypothetical protein